jgi:hypothetical protein
MSEQNESLEFSGADLTDILEGETEAAELPETPAEETVEAEPQGETAEGEEPAAEGEPPAPEDDEDGKTVPLKALHDERGKRQELERRLEQLEKQQTQQPNPKAPDPVDDPEGFQQYQDQRMLNDRVELSLEIGREMHENFDEVYGVFLEEAANNPLLAQKALQAKAPGLHCYREGLKLMKTREIGDPETYAQRKVEESTAALRKELDELKQQMATGTKRAQIPPSLAESRSSGAGNPKQPTHTPLSSILPD